MDITFIATRSIAAGYTLNDLVTISVSITEFEPALEQGRNQKSTISGKRLTVERYAIKRWSITAEPMSGTSLDEMRMFLDSTRVGEVYDITDIDSGSTITVRTDNTYNESRFAARLGPFQHSWVAVENV